MNEHDVDRDVKIIWAVVIVFCVALLINGLFL